MIFPKNKRESIDSIVSNGINECLKKKKLTEALIEYETKWKLDRRIYYLVDGCTKPQIFKNLAKVGCLSYGKICG